MSEEQNVTVTQAVSAWLRDPETWSFINSRCDQPDAELDWIGKCLIEIMPTFAATRLSDQAFWEGFRSSVSEALEEGQGCWEPCTGCHETEDGQEVGNYTYNDVLRCRLGGGCPECGGIGAVWHDYRGIEEWALETLSTPTEAQPELPGDVVEALRLAMIKADGDDCDTERAEFYLQALQRQGLTVALFTPTDEAELVKHMAERFLNWPLPESFCPDNGISVKNPYEGQQHEPHWQPVGTNLFSFEQARQMVLHMLEGAPALSTTPTDRDDVLDAYDAGLLGDYGGGNVEWWQDYIRSELGRAHEFYQSQVSALKGDR